MINAMPSDKDRREIVLRLYATSCYDFSLNCLSKNSFTLIKVPNLPVRLSRTPPVVDKPAPFVGEHTRQVLRDVAGYSQQDIERLEQEGVIRSRPET